MIEKRPSSALARRADLLFPIRFVRPTNRAWQGMPWLAWENLYETGRLVITQMGNACYRAVRSTAGPESTIFTSSACRFVPVLSKMLFK